MYSTEAFARDYLQRNDTMRGLPPGLDPLVEKVFECAFLAKPTEDGTADHRIYKERDLCIEYKLELGREVPKVEGQRYPGRVDIRLGRKRVFSALLHFKHPQYNFMRTLVAARIEKYSPGSWERRISRLYVRRAVQVAGVMRRLPVLFDYVMGE